MKQNAQVFGQQAGQWGEQLRQRIVAEAHQAGQPYPAAGWAVPPGATANGRWICSCLRRQGWVPPGPGAVPVPPPEWELERARREPIGAIVLILLGMLFLFNTLGFFNFGWVSHGWPLIIVAIAVWLLVRARGGFTRRRLPGAWPAPPPPPAAKPGAAGRRCAMNQYIFLRRMRGPIILLTFGITAILDEYAGIGYGAQLASLPHRLGTC